MSSYYVRRTGQITGPFSGTELKTFSATGRLLPSDEISRDRAQWSLAAQVPELEFRALPPPVPPPVIAKGSAEHARIKHAIAGASATLIVIAFGQIAYWLVSSREASPPESPPLKVPAQTARTVVKPKPQALEEKASASPSPPAMDPTGLPNADANILSLFCEQNKVLAHRVLNNLPIVAYGTIESIDIERDGSIVVGFETDSFRELKCVLPHGSSDSVEMLRVGGDASFAGTIEVDRHIRLLNCQIVSDDASIKYDGFPELRSFEKTRLERAVAMHQEVIEELQQMRGSVTQRQEARRAIQERELRIKACRALIELIDKAQSPSTTNKELKN